MVVLGYFEFVNNFTNACKWDILRRKYNMFNRAAGGRALTRSESCGKGVIIMSTYEEFMIALTTALLIVAILNLKNKK